jgi:hypothetical protein
MGRVAWPETVRREQSEGAAARLAGDGGADRGDDRGVVAGVGAHRRA